MRMREERTAFERLFRGHQLAVYRYALRRVGEKAVDDVVAEHFWLPGGGRRRSRGILCRGC